MQAPQHAPTDDPIRVLVVDADRRVRQSLCGLIDLAEGMEIAGAAGDPGTALAGLQDGPVDLVVMDPRLPEFDAGLALVAEIRRGWPETVVLALSWPGDLPAEGDRWFAVLPASVQPDSLVEMLRDSVAGRAR